jgi:hypothetical protein
MVALRATLIVMHHDALADSRHLRVDGAAHRDYHAAGFVSHDDRTLVDRNAGGL